MGSLNRDLEGRETNYFENQSTLGRHLISNCGITLSLDRDFTEEKEY